MFLRKDFEDLGGYDQVGRVLRKLVEQQELVRIGYGLYAKAKLSITKRQPIPRVGIRPLLREALGRLGVTTAPSTAERDYNSGKSTQVPTGRVIGVKGKRISRKIGYNGVTFGLERVE